MNTHYTIEKHVQILIALLKANNIRKIIASPGTTNITFVASVQSDNYFEMYSAADERSAAYIACGLAAESGEPVVLSCTGATASRNYYPGLTEAYYRHLPILAVTASQVLSHAGGYFPQMLDRSVVAKDVVKHSVAIEPIDCPDDEWKVTDQINVAILELFRNGGGPVHINCATRYSKDFSVKELPNVRVIKRYMPHDQLPTIPKGKIGIYVGSHPKWTAELTEKVDKFCDIYNAVVFGDHTSNYKGRYKIIDSLLGSSTHVRYRPSVLDLDLLIHIGFVSGEYSAAKGKEVWRVNPDGELRNVFRNTTKIFQMDESEFFSRYQDGEKTNATFFKECRDVYNRMYQKIPELPFSNTWCAKQIAMKLPANSVLHLGILNSLRSYNFFEIPDSVFVYSNVGGFGIDGNMSSLIGASLANSNKLFFGVFGDLSFFYDMNSAGNRHVGNNVRIMLVNNGIGTEFRLFYHPANSFGDDANAYMAAAGHYGNKSSLLVKHYAEDLGYEYLCATSKEEFLNAAKRFITPELTDRPMLFEVFTDSKDESNAVYAINHVETDVKSGAKQLVKDIIGDGNIRKIKKVFGK
ncbi:MAG: 2-succinyl-5-enolpyruvyl-6-hydroxy-3-cyclohexene-1-carboxylate synthase [Bacteroidales bacterium]|nr:2-succinyl-5-enolpyruvyl-6-hydroxy-3-cyclohexene-1-carboxylate synthase [Bacteroidales bacterium]